MESNNNAHDRIDTLVMLVEAMVTQALAVRAALLRAYPNDPLVIELAAILRNTSQFGPYAEDTARDNPPF